MHQDQTDENSQKQSGDHPSERGDMLLTPIRQKHEHFLFFSLHYFPFFTFILFYFICFLVLGGAVVCAVGLTHVTEDSPVEKKDQEKRPYHKRYRKPKESFQVLLLPFFLLILSPHRVAFFWKHTFPSCYINKFALISLSLSSKDHLVGGWWTFPSRQACCTV